MFVMRLTAVIIMVCGLRVRGARVRARVRGRGVLTIDNRDYVTGIGNDDAIVYIIMRTRVYIPSCKICTC